MIERIICAIVDAYKGYEGLEELQRGFAVAVSVSGMEFTEEEKREMWTEILYRLAR